jgi:hypothetical protein
MIPTLGTERTWARLVQAEDAEQVQRIFPRWGPKRLPMHANFVLLLPCGERFCVCSALLLASTQAAWSGCIARPGRTGASTFQIQTADAELNHAKTIFNNHGAAIEITRELYGCKVQLPIKRKPSIWATGAICPVLRLELALPRLNSYQTCPTLQSCCENGP